MGLFKIIERRMEEIYGKVLRGEKLTPDELCDLYQEPGSDIVVYEDSESLGEDSVKHYIVIKLGDQFFKAYATIGLGGEDYYRDQPEEVTPVKEVVEITKWVKK